MLINKVSKMNKTGEVIGNRADDQTQEYQTASELFDVMTKEQLNVVDSLTASDIVLLYKNFDVATNLVSESRMVKRSNQYVETVVYEDDHDSEDSEINEMYNTDGFNIYEYNKERLDIFNNDGSLENPLCQKLEGIEIQSSKLNNEYHQHLNIFQDHSVKNHLKYSFGLDDVEGLVLPTTLLDYICCKRLEDNYNFYIDNIIRYVKHIIAQLKRISNGDYLTDKAKEKWREVSYPVNQTNSTKILATSTSIPLHIERKTSNLVSAWDDIVHSEVDVRSLSKILEKKIIVEVPKLICGTYKLFSRQYADNLIISCKREATPTLEHKKEDSRVDLVLQLGKSQSGHVVSNISSIMILKTQQEICVNDHLPLPYNNLEDCFFDETRNNSTNKIQISEIKHDIKDSLELAPDRQEDVKEVICVNNEKTYVDERSDINYCSIDDNASSKNQSYLESSDSYNALGYVVDEAKKVKSVFSHEIALSDEMRLKMKRFHMSSSLPEESIDDSSQNTLNLKKSPTRIRIKSPYENQSHVIEEKKRRRLLEIREKRERKKLAMGENCKINKHKYARGGVMAQASSSVTKLSITNKSFYNSIYGQTVAITQAKVKNRHQDRNDPIPEVPLNHKAENDAPVLAADTTKYISGSYHLHDTEMMYMQTKQNGRCEIKACSASTSVESSDFRANLTLLSQLIGPSATDLHSKQNRTTSDENTLLSHRISITNIKEKAEPKSKIATPSVINLAPTNASKNKSTDDINDAKKASSSVECRKSIDKIYDLMKKLEKGDGEENQPKTKLATVHSGRLNVVGQCVSSTIQGSDSGTSVKHHLKSSNPSCFSFEETNNEVPKPEIPNKIIDIPVVSKVIISNKAQTIKTDLQKNKKSKRLVLSPIIKTQDNPLKAISQLLHEFDNVQKGKQKTGDFQMSKRHGVLSNDVKSISYQGSSKRRSRFELFSRDIDRTPKVMSQRKLTTSLGITKNSRQQVLNEGKPIKDTNKKITDIIDEVKEARGEAVKGPSKFYSRLNSLAQPKKSYVQARIDDHPPRTAKILIDRQQKIATVPMLSERNMEFTTFKNKVRRNRTEAVSIMTVKQPPAQPLDDGVRKRWSANCSPENMTKLTSPVSSSKKNNVPPTPESLKNMVAVNGHVKNQYKRALPTLPIRDRPLVSGHKSRISLLPKDIVLASISSVNTAQGSIEVGNKLQPRINAKLHVKASLTVLSEDLGVTCNNTDNLSTNFDLCRCEERASIDSDYTVDMFEDKHIVTAVEHIPNKTIEAKILEEDPKLLDSATEIEILKNALCRKWSYGMFQKRLRIKNLMLSPKHSMKQVFILQSSDGSRVIKSSLSKNGNVGMKKYIMQDLSTLPVLSKTNMDWNFYNFPMQISTIGYVFPHFQTPFEPNKKIKSLDEICKPAVPLNYVLGSNEKHKDIVEPSNPLIMVISEDQRNKDNKSSIPVLKITGKEEIYHSLEQGSMESLVNPYKNSGTASSSTPNRGNETTQKLNINYTTSLDMLMCLLNEIQKITSCQTHITNNDLDNQQSKELETILDEAAPLEGSLNKPRELVSITSLDKLRNLESNPSMYTIYLSSDEDSDNNSNNIVNVTTDTCGPLFVDKEVNVRDTPEFINRCTDVPSIFPLNVHHSTNVTNSLIGVLSRPSSQSIFSFMEYQTLKSSLTYSHSSFNTHKKIIQLPLNITHVHENIETVPQHNMVCKEKEKLNEKIDMDPLKLSLPCKETRIKVNQRLIRCKQIVKDKSPIVVLDPVLKMKRDILVTVYSILVITVFAALSFPEVIYHL